MNNFRKRIGNLLCLCFTLAILVTCFMASSTYASASGMHYSPTFPVQLPNVECTVVSGNLDSYLYQCRCAMYRDLTVNYLEDGNVFGSSGYCANCGHTFDEHVPLSGPDPGPVSHKHDYSTAWGAWRKISACRLSS